MQGSFTCRTYTHRYVLYVIFEPFKMDYRGIPWTLNCLGLFFTYCNSAWTITLVLDEIRQILKPKGTLKDRLSIWWSDIWNKFDCFGFLIFVLSIIYRLILITQGRFQRLPKVKGVSGIQPLENKLKPDKMNPQLIAGFKEQPSAAH